MNKQLKVYQYGNTVRLECVFFDFQGNKVDPQLVKITIYNQRYENIFNETLGINNRKDTGEYFFDYVTENKEQKLYYEWYGEINGKPSLKRGEFMTKFI